MFTAVRQGHLDDRLGKKHGVASMKRRRMGEEDEDREQGKTPEKQCVPVGSMVMWLLLSQWG